MNSRPLRGLLVLAALSLGSISAGAAGSRAAPEELAAAKALLDAGKHQESHLAYEKILAHAPDDPEANHAVGLYACDHGEWEKALACMAKALASDPNSARYQYGWGAANGIAALKSGIFSKLGYARKCLAAYERAVELEPRNASYRRALVSYYQQAPGFAGGDTAKAYAQAAEIKKFNPAIGRQAFAQLYVGDKKFDLAFREFEEVLRTQPDDYAALFSIGRIAAETGQRLDQGIASLQHCLALTPPAGDDMPRHDHVNFGLGVLWEKKNEITKARAAYEATLAINPAFGAAKRALARLERARS